MFYLLKNYYKTNDENLSLIPEKGIKIIEIVGTNDSLENEIKNYLEHHLLDEEDTFKRMNFEGPIYIKFRHSIHLYRRRNIG